MYVTEVVPSRSNRGRGLIADSLSMVLGGVCKATVTHRDPRPVAVQKSRPVPNRVYVYCTAPATSGSSRASAITG